MASPDQSPLIPAALQSAEQFCNESYLATIEKLHETRHDIHLILGGGGMKCAAIPGAMVALLEKFGLRYPERITAPLEVSDQPTLLWLEPPLKW